MFVFLMIGSSERDRRQEWEGGDWCGRHSMNHFDVCITASACMAPWLTCETRKALPAGSSRAAERGGVLSAPAVAGTGQRVDSAWAWPSTRRVLRAFPFACTGTCRPFAVRGERAKHYTVTIYFSFLYV